MNSPQKKNLKHQSKQNEHQNANTYIVSQKTMMKNKQKKAEEIERNKKIGKALNVTTKGLLANIFGDNEPNRVVDVNDVDEIVVAVVVDFVRTIVVIQLTTVKTDDL
jgi:hypothetical protein